jgi:hypothetical protein
MTKLVIKDNEEIMPVAKEVVGKLREIMKVAEEVPFSRFYAGMVDLVESVFINTREKVGGMDNKTKMKLLIENTKKFQDAKEQAYKSAHNEIMSMKNTLIAESDSEYEKSIASLVMEKERAIRQIEEKFNTDIRPYVTERSDKKKEIQENYEANEKLLGVLHSQVTHEMDMYIRLSKTSFDLREEGRSNNFFEVRIWKMRKQRK